VTHLWNLGAIAVLLLVVLCVAWELANELRGKADRTPLLVMFVAVLGQLGGLGCIVVLIVRDFAR
jgi:hypothetical protein